MPASKSKTWYAVSDIKHGTVDENGKNSFANTTAGSEVDPSTFDEDEWQELVDAGSVTTTPPEDQDELNMTPEAQAEQSVTAVAGAPKASGAQLDAGGK